MQKKRAILLLQGNPEVSVEQFLMCSLSLIRYALCISPISENKNKFGLLLQVSQKAQKLQMPICGIKCRNLCIVRLILYPVWQSYIRSVHDY